PVHAHHAVAIGRIGQHGATSSDPAKYDEVVVPEDADRDEDGCELDQVGELELAVTDPFIPTPIDIALQVGEREPLTVPDEIWILDVFLTADQFPCDLPLRHGIAILVGQDRGQRRSAAAQVVVLDDDAFLPYLD